MKIELNSIDLYADYGRVYSNDSSKPILKIHNTLQGEINITTYTNILNKDIELETDINLNSLPNEIQLEIRSLFDRIEFLLNKQ